MKLVSKLFLLAAGIAVAAPAAAYRDKESKPSAHVEALGACRSIADPAERLACYDKAAEALVTATRTGDVSVVDRAQLRQARKSLFGFNMPRLPFFDGDKSADDVPDKLVSKVASVRDLGHSRYQVRLEDGDATWETLEAPISFAAPKKGDSVEIRRGPLGSYMLRFGRQRGVKGKRVG